MQTAESDWTLSTTHYVVAIAAAIGGMLIGAATAVWRMATRARDVDARLDAVETRTEAGEKGLAKVEDEVATLRDRVGALPTRDDMFKQFGLVLTELGSLQTRVDRLHDKRAGD